MIPKGRLFVFEGADAVGKSSVCNLFVEWLNSQGEEVDSLSFPGKDPGTMGELVYRLQERPTSLGVKSPTASSLQALHIAAHLNAIETRIIPSLKAGKTVVLDRYWWSTRVYGLVGGAREDILDKLIEAEQVAWEGWLPTAVFCIGRSTPLRDEPPEMWSRWKDGYELMIAQESGRYPIHHVRNESSISDCLASIIRLCPPLS